MTTDLVKYIMREGLKIMNRISDNSFLLCNTSGEKWKCGWERKWREELMLGLFLLQFLEKKN
jgi:hypothetical protein